MSTLSQFVGGSTIKSIQRGLLTVPNSVTTATVSIPVPVNPSKSVLTLLGNSTALYDNVNRTAYVEINGAGTTLTASGASNIGSAVSPITISWQIVEYN